MNYHVRQEPGEVRAGLSPSARRRVMEMVEAHLDEVLTLDRLAAEARSIERAKSLLRTGQPLGEVALTCGYGSQSHFNRAFKTATDRTPGEWRRWS